MREEGIEKEGEPLHVMIDVDSFTKCQYLFFVLLQKEHSTRVYKQALEVYRGQGWTLAEVCYVICLVVHHQRYTQHAAVLHMAGYLQLLLHELHCIPSGEKLGRGNGITQGPK